MVEKKSIKKVPVKKAVVKTKTEVKTTPVKSRSSITKNKKVIAKIPERNFNNNLILSIILGIFILVSAFQSFQIKSLQTQIEDGGVKISSSSGNSYSSSSGSKDSSIPSNLQNLPDMVGGC